MTGDFDRFRSRLVAFLETTDLFPRQRLHIDLLLNPGAGALRGHRLARLVDRLGALPARTAQPDRVKVTPWVTEYPGHERQILAHLQELSPTGPGEQRLVVSAGGDGTARGALISALGLPEATRQSLLFFRMPLGTGNDASDAPSWDEALRVLAGDHPEARIQALDLVEVDSPRGPLGWSFNIASLGLDAFVAHLTNRLKGAFPGDSYRLMVDAATLFYEAFVKVVPSRLVLTRQGQPVFDRTQPFLLVAMGTTGHRTYGGGVRVLPDDDNVCLAGKKNLLTKLAYRQPFYRGTHRSLDGIVLAQGDRLVVESPVRVPLQMDGEVVWLDPEAFPVTLQTRPSGLRVLTLARTGNAT